ncbi:MAG: hypothetical protein ACRDPA_02835, partial [Solirubrobacteraceae bacterium]
MTERMTCPKFPVAQKPQIVDAEVRLNRQPSPCPGLGWETNRYKTTCVVVAHHNTRSRGTDPDGP